jgi:sugar lactone lactonase YvrE
MSDYRVLRLALSDLVTATGANEANEALGLSDAKVLAKTEVGNTQLTAGGIVYNGITALCTDYSGNIYGVATSRHVIVKIDEGGRINWVAGKAGTSGNNGTLNNVAAIDARFNAPEGIACDKSGTIYVADAGNHQIRTIKDGKVNVLAGSAGLSGLVDGSGETARFYTPIDIAVDKTGTVWVADKQNHALRKITNDGMVLTVAGNGTAGYVNNVQANNHVSMLKLPSAVAVDGQGNVYVSSASAAGITTNNIIKKYTPDGWLYRFSGSDNVGRGLGLGGSTVATCSQFTCDYTAIFDLACDLSSNVYVVDHMTTAGRLLKLNRDGVPAEVADWNGNSYHGPYSIAVSPAQTLFVANAVAGNPT